MSSAVRVKGIIGHIEPNAKRKRAKPSLQDALKPYTPPSWARQLPAPRFRVQLGMLGTPLCPWRGFEDALDFDTDVEFWIKRDDMTGFTCTGNKVRKLEFLLAEAIAQKSTCIVTCGALQSNHARAAAVTARELGLGAHLVLRDITKPAPSPSTAQQSTHSAQAVVEIPVTSIPAQGNVLVDRLVGAQVTVVPDLAPKLVSQKMHEICAKLREQGEVPYLIPVGGSDHTIGVWGYISCFEELMQQGLQSNGITDLVCVAGSGGTVAGLAIANYLCGSPVRLHAVTVWGEGRNFHQHVNASLTRLGVTSAKSEDLCAMIDGYVDPGYGHTNPEVNALVRRVASATGIILDGVYTGKAVLGMVSELAKGSQSSLVLKGKRVLFLHTGGGFTVFDSSLDPLGEGSKK